MPIESDEDLGDQLLRSRLQAALMSTPVESRLAEVQQRIRRRRRDRLVGSTALVGVAIALGIAALARPGGDDDRAPVVAAHGPIPPAARATEQGLIVEVALDEDDPRVLYVEIGDVVVDAPIAREPLRGGVDPPPLEAGPAETTGALVSWTGSNALVVVSVADVPVGATVELSVAGVTDRVVAVEGGTTVLAVRLDDYSYGSNQHPTRRADVTVTSVDGVVLGTTTGDLIAYCPPPSGSDPMPPGSAPGTVVPYPVIPGLRLRSECP